jgi:predicted nucleotidyltransferase
MLAGKIPIDYFLSSMSSLPTKSQRPLEQHIVETIVQHVRPKRIILFGSRAREDANERSDYDIAIDDERLTPLQLAKIRVGMETVPTLLAIEVVWMSQANEVLRRRILNEGKVLYERQD